MFHPSRLEDLKKQIAHELSDIDYYGSTKLYLCWYDEFLVAKEDYNNNYPCCEKEVSLHEVIEIVREVFNRPCIIRHNVHVSPIPAGISAIFESQNQCEKYVEVCLVFN
jgi:hypothetical protein